MYDFLNNPEETISSFGNSVRNSSKNDQVDEMGAKEFPQQKKKQISLSKANMPDVKYKNVGCKNTFSVKLNRELEASIRAVLLNILQSTGEKVTIQQFVNDSVKEYLKHYMKR